MHPSCLSNPSPRPVLKVKAESFHQDRQLQQMAGEVRTASKKKVLNASSKASASPATLQQPGRRTASKGSPRKRSG